MAWDFMTINGKYALAEQQYISAIAFSTISAVDAITNLSRLKK
jgi:hypothetical protein